MPKNAVLSGIAVVAVGVAGYFIYANTMSGPLPEQYTATAWSFGNNSEVQIKYNATDNDPFTCPVTGTETAYRLYYCNKCEHKVVPQLTLRDGKYVISGYPQCPNCGSNSLIIYDPEIMPEATNAEVALPKEHP